MIYIGKVRPSIMEEPLDQPIMEFFQQYKPQQIQVSDNEDRMKELKTTIMQGFISGEMKALIRKNANVLSRNALALDIDDTSMAENELIQYFASRYGKFDYVLYPSISNGLKGVRYRLVLPLTESVQANEYKLLIQYFTNHILKEVIQNPDESNGTFSQLQGLPVITQFNSKAHIIVSKGVQQLPTQDLLNGAKERQKAQRQAKALDNFKANGTRYRNKTTELFESLVTPCGVGNRNNRIAQLTGGLLARCVDVEAAMELVKVANSYFTEPLPIDEVEDTFVSIAKKGVGR